MADVEVLIDKARSGDDIALGSLLDSYYRYLVLLARVQIGRRLQGKLDGSDIVQDTFMEAHRQITQFRGHSEGELLAWLRRILAGRIALTYRHYMGIKGRDVNLERDMVQEVDHSSEALNRDLAASCSTPSQGASRREQAVLLADALSRLPETYREVIILRHLEGLSFADVASRMKRSEDSVQKLWVRGLAALRQAVGDSLLNYDGPPLERDLTRLMPGRGDDDPRLAAALQEYLSAIEAGRRADIPELLGRHPEVAEDLLACIQGLALVNAAAEQMGASDSEAGLSRQPLGDFKLIRQIGRGGMGTVYEAVQLSLGRRVAVKVLPLAAAMDEKHLQRFKNEAQAAAQLHHTNIVPVYAVGCERSVHFYAMQLIDGQSLSDVIEQLRRGKPSTDSSTGSLPSQTLSTLRGRKRSDYFRMVARLGYQAADALNYAHQLGVVHRDIKPANLMVDRRENIWITDFGLAQFYNDDNLTRTGDVLGTLRYMSPEQASGRATVLDQRTDIYSLGMTLYELATLERALPGETREELLRQIGVVDPRPPRAIDKTVPMELETILAKATAKEPSERYATAKALADDLQRFLDDQPILARPPSAWNRAVKWTRRHRSLTLSAIVMLLIVAIGSLTTTLLIAREQAKTRAAYLNSQNSFEQALDAVNFFTEVAADELPKDPHFNDVRKHLLEVALDYYQSFIDQHKGDASISFELAAAKARAFSILTELSAVDEMGREMFNARMLDELSVQRDLNLTSDQTEKINRLSQQWSPPPPGGQGGPGDRGFAPPPPPQESGDQVAAKTAKLQADLSSILTPAQLSRLHEISRQIRGAVAFGDPDVEQALHLSDAQKEEIRRIRNASSDRRHMFPGPGFNPTQRSAEVDSILDILSSTQKQSWNQLTGKPFTANPFLFDRGFGFGP